MRKKVEEKLSVILGSGEYRYRVVDGWAKLPDNWTFMDVAAVAVDSKIKSLFSTEESILWLYSIEMEIF